MRAGRYILKALGVFSGVQAAGILCSVVRSKLIALWIGPAGVGLFAVFNNVLTMMSTATQLNLRQSAVRDISAASQARVPAMAGAVRWWTRRLGAGGAALTLALSPLLSLVSFGHTGYWWAFAALAAAVWALTAASGEQALMQGTGALRPLARSTVLTAVTATALSVPLYYFFGEGSIIPSILLFAAATLVYSAAMCRVPSARNSRGEKMALGRGFLRLGAFLTVSSVTATAASYIFVSYLNNRYDPAITGYFQAGHTLVIQYTGIIFTALAMEYYPRVAQIADRPRMATTVLNHEIRIILYILTPLLVVFVAADSLAMDLLYSAEFSAALPFVTVGIGAMVFRAVSYCLAYVIIGRGDGRLYILTEVTSSALGLGLNITMFTLWGFSGLGLSYVLWYALYTLMVWAVCRRYGVALRRGTLWLGAASCALVGGAIVLKSVGWWAALALAVPAVALAAAGYRALIWRRR